MWLHLEREQSLDLYILLSCLLRHADPQRVTSAYDCLSRTFLLPTTTSCAEMPQNRGDADAVQTAHAAFRTTAKRQLRGLIAHGMEGGAASGRLLDDLIVLRTESAGGSGGRGASGMSSQAGSGSSSSLSIRHVVACTGASPSQATKILQLKEEISSLRRDGYSTVTVIEQLGERLRLAGEKRQSWAEDAENAALDGSKGGMTWWDKGGAVAKKRRVGDETSFLSAFAAGRGIENSATSPHGVGSCGANSPVHHGAQLHELCFSPGTAAYIAGNDLPLEAKPDGKRSREESAPLAQLKKLKLLNES